MLELLGIHADKFKIDNMAEGGPLTRSCHGLTMCAHTRTTCVATEQPPTLPTQETACDFASAAEAEAAALAALLALALAAPFTANAAPADRHRRRDHPGRRRGGTDPAVRDPGPGHRRRPHRARRHRRLDRRGRRHARSSSAPTADTGQEAARTRLQARRPGPVPRTATGAGDGRRARSTSRPPTRATTTTPR